MKCRDCGGPRDRIGVARPDVCLRCWRVRGLVVKAMACGKMVAAHFEEYQRARHRTLRLARLGYQWIVDQADEAPA